MTLPTLASNRKWCNCIIYYRDWE